MHGSSATDKKRQLETWLNKPVERHGQVLCKPLIEKNISYQSMGEKVASVEVGRLID